MRTVFTAQVVKVFGSESLIEYLSDRTPSFYRNFKKLSEDLKDGFYISSFKQTLARLPNHEHFQSSHFGEISASVFVEEVLGIKKIYSKLSLNTTENQNAYKMDLVCFVPGSDPMEFVFCEVKSSNKHKKDGFPAGHDKSCYADIFNSLKKYNKVDLDFDLTAIKDNLDSITEPDRANIRRSLIPYSPRKINYKGIAVIDLSTIHEEECNVLCKRKSDKEFDVEVVGIEDFKKVAEGVYQKLESIKRML